MNLIREMEYSQRNISMERKLEELNERIMELETEQRRMQDNIRYSQMNVEDRLLFLEKQWELNHSISSSMQTHIQKIDGEHQTMSTCLNANCRDLGKLERDFKKKNGEYKEDIARVQETLKNYKKENETLSDTIETMSIFVLDRKDETNKLRHRIVDVSIDMEKIEEEIKEINKNAMFKKDALENFQPVMARINELEMAIKSVSTHKSSIQQIIERLKALENP